MGPWAEAHRVFHRTLLEGCGNPVLLETFDRMRTASELARRRSAHRNPDRDGACEHRLLEEAALTTFEPSAGRRCHSVVNPVHSCVYFAPERQDELAALGLERGAMAYFADRAAPLGAVGAGTVSATFYNFNHEHVERFIPAAWSIATPEAVLAARLRGADKVLRRLFGEEALTSKEMAEARPGDRGPVRDRGAGPAQRHRHRADVGDVHTDPRVVRRAVGRRPGPVARARPAGRGGGSHGVGRDPAR